MCCSVLQRVAVCCIVLQCRVVWCIVLQCAAVHSTHSHVQVRSTKRQILAFGHGSVLQSAAVCCCVLRCVAGCSRVWQCVAACCSVLHCVAGCCIVLQCDNACCSVLQSWQCVTVCDSQRVAVCCSVHFPVYIYGVATTSRLLKIMGLFCKRAL